MYVQVTRGDKGQTLAHHSITLHHPGRHSHTTTRRRPNVGLMLGQRRRRWHSIKPTLGRRLVSGRGGGGWDLGGGGRLRRSLTLPGPATWQPDPFLQMIKYCSRDLCCRKTHDTCLKINLKLVTSGAKHTLTASMLYFLMVDYFPSL